MIRMNCREVLDCGAFRRFGIARCSKAAEYAAVQDAAALSESTAVN